MITTRGNGRSFNAREYEWKSASITLTDANATTDLSTITGFTTLFTDVPIANHIEIRSSADITLRLNKATNNIITVGTTTPFTSDCMEITDIFVGTAAAVTLTVILM